MHDPIDNRLSRRLAYLSMVVYGVSFALPVTPDSIIGFHAFLSGIIGLLMLIPVWLANPFLWIGWGLIFGGKPRGAAICGWLATPLAILTLVFGFGIEFGLQSAGYWAWTASMVLLLAAGLTGTPVPDVLEPEDYDTECANCGERFRRLVFAHGCPMCGDEIVQMVTPNGEPPQ